MGYSETGPEARKELIAKKAQELYEKRGREPGHELDDWLTAEKMVDREMQQAKPATASRQPQPVATPAGKTSPKPGQRRF
jgi:hypothetical protein